jgi:hypothetical protein
MFGGGFDLAAVASAAGLGGSAVAAIGAAIFFKGLIMRILAQVVVTAALTFVGFIALLQVMGYAIVPKDETAAAPSVATRSGDDIVRPQFDTAGATPEAVPAAAVEAEKSGKKVFYLQRK